MVSDKKNNGSTAPPSWIESPLPTHTVFPAVFVLKKKLKRLRDFLHRGHDCVMSTLMATHGVAINVSEMFMYRKVGPVGSHLFLFLPSTSISG
jgi:hypothetical protein